MQFDIYKNNNDKTSDEFPYLLDIQSNTLGKLATRMIVPMIPASKISKKISIINPIITIDSIKYIALFDELASYPKSELIDIICNAANKRDELLKAFDFLIQGY